MLERMVDRLARRSSAIDPVEVRRRNLIPPLRQRPRRHHRPDLRQRQLPARRSTRRSTTSATTTLRAEQADGARAGPLHRHRRRHLRRDLRPRPVTGGGRDRVPGRAVGERDRPLSSDRQGATSSSAPRRTARARRRPSRRSSPTSSASASTTSRSCTATPTTRRWAGAPTAAGPPRSAARRWPSRRARSRTRRSCSPAHLLEAAVEDMDYADGKFFVKGSPGPREDDPGHRADGQRRLEHAAGHGSRARGDRASTTRRTSSIRSARTSRWSRSIRRPAAST